ncbi:hypothetical protein HOY80DRAFT_1136842 [Tuber brumale]|nr:hypothetical protein HOY80DRAFT_1136842 [Tuber brumale]
MARLLEGTMRSRMNAVTYPNGPDRGHAEEESVPDDLAGLATGSCHIGYACGVEDVYECGPDEEGRKTSASRWLKDTPTYIEYHYTTGDVDEMGYFKFSGPAGVVRKAVEPVHQETYENGMDGKRFGSYGGGHQWELCGETEVEGPGAVWALEIGVEAFFRVGAFGTMATRTPIVLMRAKKHGGNKYHRTQVAEDAELLSKGWSTRTLNVGGPDDFKK